MTALINTHSGEKIEAMVGDVVRHKSEPIAMWLIESANSCHEIHIVSTTSSLTRSGILCKRFKFASADDCTLLHRSLQIGMDVEFNYYANWWVPLVLTQNDAEYANGVELFRHANPAWRDHPDYRPEVVK